MECIHNFKISLQTCLQGDSHHIDSIGGPAGFDPRNHITTFRNVTLIAVTFVIGYITPTNTIPTPLYPLRGLHESWQLILKSEILTTSLILLCNNFFLQYYNNTMITYNLVVYASSRCFLYFYYKL